MSQLIQYIQIIVYDDLKIKYSILSISSDGTMVLRTPGKRDPKGYPGSIPGPGVHHINYFGRCQLWKNLYITSYIASYGYNYSDKYRTIRET